jgi:hypothetical protein
LTRRTKYAAFAFAAALGGAATFVLLTVPAMPELVASQFDLHGSARAWMRRGGYRLFMLLLATGLPLAVVALVAVLPRIAPPRWINLPHRDHWLAPARRDAALDWLAGHALLLGTLLSLLACAMHALLLAANAQSPARLASGPFLAAIGAFIAAFAAWIAAVKRRFHEPR